APLHAGPAPFRPNLAHGSLSTIAYYRRNGAEYRVVAARLPLRAALRYSHSRMLLGSTGLARSLSESLGSMSVSALKLCASPLSHYNRAEVPRFVEVYVRSPTLVSLDIHLLVSDRFVRDVRGAGTTHT